MIILFDLAEYTFALRFGIDPFRQEIQKMLWEMKLSIAQGAIHDIFTEMAF